MCNTDECDEKLLCSVVLHMESFLRSVYDVKLS